MRKNSRTQDLETEMLQAVTPTRTTIPETLRAQSANFQFWPCFVPSGLDTLKRAPTTLRIKTRAVLYDATGCGF